MTADRLGRGCYRALGLIVLALAMFPAGAGAGDLTGRAVVTDGDTIRLGSDRVRLYGIDAPELAQRCRLPSGATWTCGEAAKRHLQAAIGDAAVTCAVQDRDRYGRAVAVCRVGGVDLGEAMVRDGLAVDYLAYSHGRYAREESEAKANGRGIWVGSFDRPADYRREHRR